jgi:two-component system, OmpR family, phosphate regulon sensor histidine kinase PhoR
MKSFRWLTFLMCIAIIGIASFLFYWLRQTYNREEASLEIKTSMLFREAVMGLQASKLKFEKADPAKQVSNPAVKIIMTEGADSLRVRARPAHEIISSINVIRSRVKDAVKGTGEKRMVITMNEAEFAEKGNNTRFARAMPSPGGKNGDVFKFLIGVDSLQDSIRILEIDSLLHKQLADEKINIPFSITKKEVKDDFFSQGPWQVVVGFSKPVVFEMQTGNTISYLLKRIAQPILFSILLLGITLLSFVLLYRNMLRQRRLADQKNEFISNITHELKTPLATVGVAIEALKNFNAIDNPAKTKEYLDISQNELLRLNLLVDKVLKLSMFEKKEIELKPEIVNMAGVIEEVTTSLKLQFEKYQAVVNIHTNGDTTVKGDRLHLLSVIFNLLDNALKYSNKNPVISISCVSNESTVTITVSDNGIGIPAAYTEKVFEKFFRVPHGDTHNAKGYGLGLSYVAQVVEKHNGTIKAVSDGSSGASFIITLPKS